MTLVETGHHDRSVWIDRSGPTPIAVKRYTVADGQAIFDASIQLWRTSFGHIHRNMPEPLAFVGDALTMEYVDGYAIGERGSLGSVLVRLDDVAVLLARLHSAPVNVTRIRSAAKIVRSLGRKRDTMTGSLATLYGEALSHVSTVAPTAEERVLTHGDFSPRNVFAHADSLVLIDFDRIQMAGRGRDVHYLGAWCWTTLLMSDGVGSWTPGDNFATAYAARAPGATGELAAGQRFHRAAGLLRIAQSWTALATRPDLAEAVIHEAIDVTRRE
jgi:aminoglycoside phosphotransferase (APT) family kinase protein